jgi:hypothetical protein
MDDMQRIYEKAEVQFQKGEYSNRNQESRTDAFSSCMAYDHCCPDLPLEQPNMYKFSCLIKQKLTWDGCKHCLNKAHINSPSELVRFKKFAGRLEDIAAEKNH